MTALPLFDTSAFPGYPAVFSPCRTYRYVLWRAWGPPPYMMIVGLNPSTADENNDDPTIRRCIGFAKREKMGALCMTNVYAYRETDPRVMLNRSWGTNVVGPDNGRWLAECAKKAALIVCAWGKHAQGREAKSALSILRENNQAVMCFGTNKDGTPKHPLYLAADTPLLNY